VFRARPESPERGAGLEIVVLSAGFLAVASGVARLINETHAHGARALRYAQMEAVFLAARTDLSDPGRDGPGRTLLELGKEALAESGDWVLLHRGRPLEIPRAA